MSPGTERAREKGRKQEAEAEEGGAREDVQYNKQNLTQGVRKKAYISKPDGSCRRPIKDSKILRNAGFLWVLGFGIYRSF